MRRYRGIVLLLVVLAVALGTAWWLWRPKPDSAAEKVAPMSVVPQGSSTVKRPDPTIDRTGWPVIVAFGDSLTAGLGVAPEENYPSQLQALLDDQGYKYRVVNAGISGDLSLGGLNRVESILEHEPAIVIVELGANDGLQGKSVTDMKQNLGGIIERLQQAEVKVVLAGMEAPPNYGPEYTQEFRGVFKELADRYQVALIPFFLEGVGGMPDLNRADGIHPTAEGYTIVVKTVMRALEPLLTK